MTETKSDIKDFDDIELPSSPRWDHLSKSESEKQLNQEKQLSNSVWLTLFLCPAIPILLAEKCVEHGAWFLLLFTLSFLILLLSIGLCEFSFGWTTSRDSYSTFASISRMVAGIPGLFSLIFSLRLSSILSRLAHAVAIGVHLFFAEGGPRSVCTCSNDLCSECLTFDPTDCLNENSPTCISQTAFLISNDIPMRRTQLMEWAEENIMIDLPSLVSIIFCVVVVSASLILTLFLSQSINKLAVFTIPASYGIFLVTVVVNAIFCFFSDIPIIFKAPPNSSSVEAVFDSITIALFASWIASGMIFQLGPVSHNKTFSPLQLVYTLPFIQLIGSVTGALSIFVMYKQTMEAIGRVEPFGDAIIWLIWSDTGRVVLLISSFLVIVSFLLYSVASMSVLLSFYPINNTINYKLMNVLKFVSFGGAVNVTVLGGIRLTQLLEQLQCTITWITLTVELIAIAISTFGHRGSLNKQNRSGYLVTTITCRVSVFLAVAMTAVSLWRIVFDSPIWWEELREENNMGYHLGGCVVTVGLLVLSLVICQRA